MRIVDLLHEQGIDLNFNPKNKAEAIIQIGACEVNLLICKL